MKTRRISLGRPRLRHALFFALLLAGVIPLLVSSLLLIWKSGNLLEDRERDLLLRSAESLSRELDMRLGELERRGEQLGTAMLAAGGVSERTPRAQRAAQTLFEQFWDRTSGIRHLSVVDRSGEGPKASAGEPGTPLAPAAAAALEEAVATAFESGETVHRLVLLAGDEPAALLAVPVAPGEAVAGGEEAGATSEPALVTGILARLDLPGEGDTEAFLLDRDAGLLWSAGTTPEAERALLGSPLAGELLRRPMSMTTEYSAGGRELVARLSPVPESGWVVVTQQPADLAYEAADEMVVTTLLSVLLLVALALFLALWVARRVGEPLQRLAATSHEIAHGHFGERVETRGLLFELADLGADFNRMSLEIAGYVEKLQAAARANRELFIGALRAFTAAVDAKDPYTRGHSERVAALSRTIARHLGLSDEQQERVWIAALLHDVGKIGVEDAILQKVGKLTDEELAAMRRHPVIGADIIGPIAELQEAIPVIRWHHENWNGRGYPDGLKGEEIPLLARVVAVADTFDAVTTNRPYQQAYTLEFAVETIVKLTGTRFDAKVVTAFLRAYELGEIRPAATTREAAASTASEVRSRVAAMS